MTYWRLKRAKSAISSTIHSGKEKKAFPDSAEPKGNCSVTLPMVADNGLIEDINFFEADSPSASSLSSSAAAAEASP